MQKQVSNSPLVQNAISQALIFVNDTMAPGLSGSSGSEARPSNSRSDDTNSGNFVTSNTGLFMPSEYASPRRNSQSYTSFFDPDYFIRPTTSNTRQPPSQDFSGCSSSPSTSSQRPADGRWEYVEQEDRYEFRPRNDCRKVDEEKKSTISQADQGRLSQEYNDHRFSTPNNNVSCSQFYETSNGVHSQSPIEQSRASAESSTTPYKRSYASSHQGQSRSNAPTPAKRACQQDVGHTSKESEATVSPLEFGLDAMYARLQENKTDTERVSFTPDRKSPKLYDATKSREPTFSSRPSSFWGPAFPQLPAEVSEFYFPDHRKPNKFADSKAYAPLSSHFLPAQLETPKDSSTGSMQPNQVRTHPVQTTSNHPSSAESSDDYFSSQNSTTTKFSENGLPLVNKKDMMVFPSWRNKNKFVVYPEESNEDPEESDVDTEESNAADLEKSWLRSISANTGQNPTELDRRRFYAMRSKYPYEELGELNEVMKPGPMNEIVVDERSYEQPVSAFLCLGQTPKILRKVRSLGGLERDIHKEESPETDPPHRSVHFNTNIPFAKKLTSATENAVNYVDKGTQADNSSHIFGSSFGRRMTFRQMFLGQLPSDRADICPKIPPYSNGGSMEKPEESKPNTSNSSSSKIQPSSVQYVKPEAQKDIQSDTKPGWKPGCSPNFGPNKPGRLYDTKCEYCQKLWRGAKDSVANQVRQLDLDLNLKTFSDSLRRTILEQFETSSLADIEAARWNSLYCHTCADVEPEEYELQAKARQQKAEISDRLPLFPQDTMDSNFSWMEAKHASVGTEQEKGRRENINDKQDVNMGFAPTKRYYTAKEIARYRVASWIEMRKKALRSERAMQPEKAMPTGQVGTDVFTNQVDGNDEDPPAQSSDSFYSIREISVEVSTNTNSEEEQVKDVADQEDADMEDVSDSSEWAKAEQGSVSSEDEEYQRVEVSSNQDMDIDNASDSSGWTRTSQWLAASEDEEFEII